MEKTNEINFKACLEKAQAIVESYKTYYSPECFIKDSPTNGGSAPSAQSENDVLSAYQHYFPSILSELGAATPNMAQQQATGVASSQPIYNNSNLSQLREYGVPLTDAANAVTDAQAQGGARTNLNLLTGAGGAAATAASNLNRQLNPNYYGTMDAASKGIQSELSGINLTGLSPGESAAIERSTNRGNSATGNLGLSNGTNIISDAMNFGGAFNNKLGIMNNAAGTAANIAGVASGNGGFSPVSVALGQPSSTGGNLGTSMFSAANPSGITGAAGSVGSGSGSLLGQMGMQNATATSGSFQNMINNSVQNSIPSISC